MATNYEQQLLTAGANKDWIYSQTGVGKKINPTEYQTLLSRWQSQGQTAKPAVAQDFVYGTNYPTFQWNANQQLPAIQQQAASIYQPQLQALEALRGLGKSSYETTKATTESDFQKRMQAEIEAVNNRGAYFSGGAIQHEQDLRSENARNLQQQMLQWQASDFQNLAQQAGLTAEQTQYIQEQLYSAQGSAYQRYMDQYSTYWNAQQAAQQQSQFEANLAFDKAQFAKELGLRKSEAKADLKRAEEAYKKWEAEQTLDWAQFRQKEQYDKDYLEYLKSKSGRSA